MKNKIFATIGGAVAALCPWVTHAETFPTDGNMLENKTYESAATYNNLGTYAGPVSAAAEYADILYQVGAGQYLPAGSEGVGAVCTAGNYCPGLTDATYNATDNQGLTACPNGYPMSESGASVNTQCYTPCTDASVIAHATAVAGNDYYGNGTDTCYPTACDNGYHTYNGIEMLEQDSLIGFDPSFPAYTYASISADGAKHGETGFSLTENNTWLRNLTSDKVSGIVHGQASCQGESPNALAMYSYSGMVGHPGAYTADEVREELTKYVDSAKANAIADVFAEYKSGTKTLGDLWKTAWAILGSEYDASFSKSDSGQYCYCQMTAYGEDMFSDEVIPVTSAPWVFLKGYGSANDCAISCAHECAQYSQGDGGASEPIFNAAIYGMLGSRVVNVCAANEISITWADADPADVAANNAGVCTYDGDIRTPAKAITKPGKTFKGWKFQKSN